MTAAVSLLGLLVGGANADITINVKQDGDYVTVSSAGGNLDTTGLAMTSVSIFGAALVHGGLSTNGMQGNGTNAARFASGTSTITKTASPGWTTGSGSSAVAFSQGPVSTTVLLGEFFGLNVMLSDGAVVGNNVIPAFSATTTATTTLAGIGYTANESVTHSWEADSVTIIVEGATAPPPTLSLSPLTVAEASGTSTLTLALSSPWHSDLTFSVTASSGTATAMADFVESAVSVTIPAGFVSADFPFFPVDDHQIEGDETFSLSVQCDSPFVADQMFELTLVDDDVPVSDGVIEISDVPDPGYYLATIYQGAVDADDAHIVAGIWRETVAGALTQGVVRVYDSVTRQLVRQILPPTASHYYFGWQVAIAGDLVAVANTDNSLEQVTVFEISSGNLVHSESLGSRCSALDLTDDHLAIGLAGENEVRVLHTGTWQSFDVEPSGSVNLFGQSVALYGSNLVVGDVGAAVYLFDLTGPGSLHPLVHKVLAPQGGQFGWSVAVNSTHFAIGTPDLNEVRVHRLSDANQTGVYSPPNNVGSSPSFGQSLAMDDRFVAVGSYLANSPNSQSGAVAIHLLSSGHRVAHFGGSREDALLGQSVALTAGAVVGFEPTINTTSPPKAKFRFFTLSDGGTIPVEAMFAATLLSEGLTDSAALPEATPFNDEVSNLLKYAFNMDLAGPDSHAMISGGDSGLPGGGLIEEGGETVWQMQFVRRKGGGLVYTPLKSTTLQPDSFVEMSGAATVTDIDDQWERVTINEPCDPASTPSCFSRVSVSLP